MNKIILNFQQTVYLCLAAGKIIRFFYSCAPVRAITSFGVKNLLLGTNMPGFELFVFQGQICSQRKFAQKNVQRHQRKDELFNKNSKPTRRGHL